MPSIHSVDKVLLSEAYIKLKSHIYYDTTELFQRKLLCEFETNIVATDFTLGTAYGDKPFGKFINTKLEEKFDRIVKAINDYHKDSSYFDKLFKKIKTTCLPKTFKKETEEPNFLINKRVKETYEVEKVTVFADIPLELHLISVLWLMMYGYRLDAVLDESCIGNRLLLNREKEGIIKGSAFFKPYFTQYQKWRDKSVEEASRKLEAKSDIAFINLDLKDYFYSARIDFSEVEEAIWGKGVYSAKGNGANVHEIFKRIHIEFTNLLVRQNYPHREMSAEMKGRTVLPIGVASSYVLGNWYLREFDKRIKKLIPQVYYSRYVDDILMVIENPDFNFHAKETCDSVRFTFDKYRVNETKDGKESISFDDSGLTKTERFLLETLYPVVKLVDLPSHFKKSNDEIDKIFKISCIDGAYFQASKTLVYYFDHEESTTVIDKLKQELEERASEFRDFPEEDPGNDSFDELAYHLIFDGTEGKVRTLKDYKENRYGLSVFLANRIFAALRRDKKVDPKETAKILKLFKGLNNLEHFRLWEKIFTYFVVNGDREGFVEFYKHTCLQIDAVLHNGKIAGSELSCQDVAIALFGYFQIAVEMALALDPGFIKIDTPQFKSLEIFFESKLSHFSSLTRDRPSIPGARHLTRFRKCNMIRHHYVAHPLLNYTKASRQPHLNLVDRHLPNVKSKAFNEQAFKFSPVLMNLSPRKVKFWECCIAVVNLTMLSDSTDYLSDRNDERYTYTRIFNDTIEDGNWILAKAYELYVAINTTHIKDIPKESEFYKRVARNNSTAEGKTVRMTELEVNNGLLSGKKATIAIANTDVVYENIEASLKGEPFLTEKRYDVFAKLFKETRKIKADMFLLPEFAVPYEFVPSLAKFSEKNNVAVVTGLEHWLADDIAYNFIVTVLPIEIGGSTDAIVLYRLKNHYAHVEEMIIRGFGYQVPKPEVYRYDLINWRNLYFTAFYCYELADVFHRSLFKAKIDLLVASEWNKDVPYFSNIVESLSRDLHCYIGQVNTSVYGDSRLTQPSESATKDILKLKGGINDTILAGVIDLDALRQFQLKSYELVKGTHDGSYKPVPPDWDRTFVRRRIKNQNMVIPED